jgi:hypothetical protein
MKFIKKSIRDLFSTLYDDNQFKLMSMPRVWCAISGLCVIAAWISEQYFGLKFAGWTQLVAWAIACLGAYAAKKYVEKDKIP